MLYVVHKQTLSSFSVLLYSNKKLTTTEDSTTRWMINRAWSIIYRIMWFQTMHTFGNVSLVSYTCVVYCIYFWRWKRKLKWYSAADLHIWRSIHLHVMKGVRECVTVRCRIFISNWMLGQKQQHRMEIHSSNEWESGWVKKSVKHRVEDEKFDSQLKEWMAINYLKSGGWQ